VGRDLRVSELPRQSLDLPLIRAQREVHGPDYSPGTSRFLAALAVAGLLVAGCGSTSHRAPRQASPAAVVRSWSTALNSGDNERAARLFALHAEIVQPGLDVRLQSHADAVAFNTSLPCAGRIVDLQTDGDTVTATFVLADRPGSPCDGPGQKARAVFRVADGKIVLWHQLPAADAPSGGAA
jgi:limonene-1,2-epoxide hydrolase